MEITKYIPLNFGLMKQWQNWAFIGLMVIIAMFGFDIILSVLFNHIHNSNNNTL